MHPLPNYARRIEYLESTGTQWIDTGVAASGDLRIVADAQYLALQSRAGLFGVVTTLRFDLVVNGNNFRWEPGYGTTYTSPTIAADTLRHTFDLSNRFVLDGVSHWVQNPATFEAEDVLIFALQRSGAVRNFAKAKVYGLSMSKTGIPVRSFVPCRVGQVGYLWDEVEGKFYGNQGTGDFVLGPDVREGVLPTPLNPFGIGRRQEKIRRVEYLESTGTNTGPWIDTGVVPDGTTRWEMDVEYGLSSVVYMGVDATQKFRIASRLGGNMDIQFALGTVYVAIKPTSFGGRHSVYLDATTKKCGVDTASANIAGSYSMSGSSIYLFGANDGSGAVTLKRKSKIYACRIFQSGILVRDFVPVAIGSTGYLLDRVSGQLFGNQGTGNFVLGPDVVPVEYVESTGSQYVDTGIVPTYDLSYTIDAAWLTNQGDVQMGCQDDTAYFLVGWRINQGRSYIYHGRTTSSSIYRSRSNAGQKVRFSFDPQTETASIDSTSGIIARTSTSTAVRSFVLFGRHVNNAAPACYSVRIFGAKLQHGETVRDFQPVRVGTEGALYDRVTDTVFRSATSTPLVAGPDARHPAG